MARRAREGGSNAEIGAELFISARTVAASAGGVRKRSVCSVTHSANVRAGRPSIRATVSSTVVASSVGAAYQPMT
ncbi:hypothetical protein AB0M28_39020 [Streptomyces sp. NPDC051940]|uniref:hypothetical protein n=1 Tax=Streptomyces sp. NPDC051940 TaxID=3155675 RepID=UPI0034189AC2